MTSPAAPYRLPYDAAPRRYELSLAPDLETLRFRGRVAIELEVLAATEEIVMNAAELEIGECGLRAHSGAASAPLRPVLEPADERVRFVADFPIAPGRYVLDCEFVGVLNDQMHGFYRSTYTGPDGRARVLAATQFQSADARRCFPCFDEPDRKASYEVTVELPPGTDAVSNGPEVARVDLGGGRARVTFAPTPVMSTYLVALIVGELEVSDTVEVAGIPVRVVTVAGKSHLGELAIAAAEHALGFYTDYFAIPYFGDKLDLVAVPDFSFGAMENVGCVTFREAILLADPQNTSRLELERLVEVTEHELAHMWFGDLVTMGWWNGLWLNESFATFMALRCSDDYHPEWNSFVTFGGDRGVALGIDALHSTRPVEFPARTPAEAEAMVDTLTYDKGAGVLWMIESYIGRDRFRAGIRDYLAEHQLANTETADLWDALGRQAPEIPVRELMDSWIFQGGVPLVAARRTSVGRRPAVALSQAPFTYLAQPPAGVTSAVGSHWQIPVIAAHGPGLSETVRLILDDDATIEVAGPLLVNAGGTGYYRVDYDDELFGELADRLDELAPLDRFGLLADTWALTTGGRGSLARFFSLAERLGDDEDPNVWSVIIGAFSTLDLLAADEDRPLVASATRRVVGPLLERVGLARRAGEKLDDALLRSRAIATLGTVGADAPVRAQVRDAVLADLDGSHVLDPDLALAQLQVFAATADEHDLDRLLERLARPRDPKDENRVRASLGMLEDPALAARVHARCLDGIRAQDSPYLLAQMLRSRALAHPTFAFMQAHFAELEALVAAYGVRRMLEGIPGLACPDRDGVPGDAGAIREFCATRVSGAHSRHLDQALERLEVNLVFGEAVRAELGSILRP